MFNKISRFFREASENRTQFFIVMGFIILPVISMAVFFYLAVWSQPVYDGSRRMMIPPQEFEEYKEKAGQKPN